MNLNHLSSVEFENYCYELLSLSGLKNINWRKGTGKSTSPSDSGRDIECEYHRYDAILDEVIIEKWFVECKSYLKGVPPEAVQGALAWASAARPDRLVIMTSNFLSNSCKDYLESYKQNNRNLFKITLFELPQIEKMSYQHSEILLKYNIESINPIVYQMNNTHLEYIQNTPLVFYNKMKELFKTLKEESQEIICEILSIYICGTNEELKKVSKNYRKPQIVTDIFSKVDVLVNDNNMFFITNAFIGFVLQLFLSAGDLNQVNSLIINRNRLISSNDAVKELLKHQYGWSDQEYKDAIEKVRKEFLTSQDMEKRDIQKYYDIYNEFCEKVVANILE